MGNKRKSKTHRKKKTLKRFVDRDQEDTLRIARDVMMRYRETLQKLSR